MRDLGVRAVVSVAVAIGIMVLMLWPDALGMSMTELNWLLLIPATFVQFWAGGVFLRNAWRQASARHGVHGHAGGAGHDGGLGLQRGGHAACHHS